MVEHPENVQQAAYYQGAPSTVSLALHDRHILLVLVQPVLDLLAYYEYGLQGRVRISYKAMFNDLFTESIVSVRMLAEIPDHETSLEGCLEIV